MHPDRGIYLVSVGSATTLALDLIHSALRLCGNDVQPTVFPIELKRSLVVDKDAELNAVLHRSRPVEPPSRPPCGFPTRLLYIAEACNDSDKAPNCRRRTTVLNTSTQVLWRGVQGGCSPYCGVFGPEQTVIAYLERVPIQSKCLRSIRLYLVLAALPPLYPHCGSSVPITAVVELRELVELIEAARLDRLPALHGV